MKIAVTIFIKDGEAWRLRNVLHALSIQSRMPDEVIIVDFGSSEENCEKYKFEMVVGLQKGLTAEYIRVEENTEVFHPARMANIATENTDCDYIITTDIDVVFTKNALELAEKEFSKGNFIMCRRKDLPEGLTPYYKKSVDITDQTDLIYDLTDVELRKGHGSFQGTRVSWLRESGGYDENFKGWGFYDMEIEWRAKHRHSIEWTMLDDIGMKMVHVHHEVLPYRDKTYQINKDYFFKKIGRET